MDSILLLQAANATSSNSITMVMLALMFLVFYFLIIRPQQKKQKETKKMLDSLKKGDKITTIGGLRATVVEVKEKEGVVILRTEADVKLEFEKRAISEVRNAKQADEAKKEDRKADKTEEKPSKS